MAAMQWLVTATYISTLNSTHHQQILTVAYNILTVRLLIVLQTKENNYLDTTEYKPKILYYYKTAVRQSAFRCIFKKEKTSSYNCEYAYMKGHGLHSYWRKVYAPIGLDSDKHASKLVARCQGCYRLRNT